MSAIDAARRIGSDSTTFGWKGNMASENQGVERITSLFLERKDESIIISWTGNKRVICQHQMFGLITQLDTPLKLKNTIRNYPDILDLLVLFPEINPVELTTNYRKLPFDDNAPEDEIISKILGREVFWFDRNTGDIHGDKVKPKRDKNFKVKLIGHRRAIHFVGSIAGLRSPMLDTILQVR